MRGATNLLASNVSGEADVRMMPVLAPITIVVCIFGAAWPVAAAPAGDACGLLTQAQVSEALGVPVGAGAYPYPSSHLSCQWSQPGANPITAKRLTLEILRPMGSLSPVDRFNNVKTPVPKVTKTPVSGVGDDAIAVTTGPITSLYVKKGSSVIRIEADRVPPDQAKTIEINLAQQAIAKL